MNHLSQDPRHSQWCYFPGILHFTIPRKSLIFDHSLPLKHNNIFYEFQSPDGISCQILKTSHTCCSQSHTFLFTLVQSRSVFYDYFSRFKNKPYKLTHIFWLNEKLFHANSTKKVKKYQNNKLGASNINLN